MVLEGKSIAVREETRTEAELSKGTSQQEAERAQEQGKATNSRSPPTVAYFLQDRFTS